MVELESHEYRYKQMDMSNVREMTVKEKLSDSACTFGKSFGFDSEKI